MARTNYSAGKRAKENERAKKRREKDERKRSRQAAGGSVPIASAEEIHGMAAEQTEDEVERAISIASSDGPKIARRVPARLFVGGLDWSCTDEKLREMFAPCGDIDEAVIVMDRMTGDSRGFGFVTMSDRKDAAKAISELDGKEVDGRTLVVKTATERPSR